MHALLCAIGAHSAKSCSIGEVHVSEWQLVWLWCMEGKEVGPEEEVILLLQGSSQIRQSFSKRKRGIAQKAYQLFKITDAKASAFYYLCCITLAHASQ